MDRLYFPFEFKMVADATEAGTFSGYGSVFGVKDAYGDVVIKGAFKDSLAEHKAANKLPPMLIQHGGWMTTETDAIPVGRWLDMEEDDIGLKATGKLINLDTDLGKRIYGAMKEGVLNGLSIGYRTKEFALGTKPDEPRRTLKKIDLVELSIVTFPANPSATIAQVKSEPTKRIAEKALREAGFSRTEAKIIVSRGYDELPLREAEADVADLIKRNIEIWTSEQRS